MQDIHPDNVVKGSVLELRVVHIGDRFDPVVISDVAVEHARVVAGKKAGAGPS